MNLSTLCRQVLYPANKSRYEYTIPSSVSTIGARAFAYSQNLSSLYVTDSVTIIDDEAFYRSSVSNLTLISKGEYGFDEYTTRLPKYLEYLGDYAFYESNIRTICENSYGSSYQPLPDTITYFGEMAFAYSKVEVVALPTSMTVVPDGLFSKCSSLKIIIFNDQLEEYGHFGCLRRIEGRKACKREGCNVRRERCRTRKGLLRSHGRQDGL